jgi:hypothetical protein
MQTSRRDESLSPAPDSHTCADRIESVPLTLTQLCGNNNLNVLLSVRHDITRREKYRRGEA